MARHFRASSFAGFPGSGAVLLAAAALTGAACSGSSSPGGVAGGGSVGHTGGAAGISGTAGTTGTAGTGGASRTAGTSGTDAAAGATPDAAEAGGGGGASQAAGGTPRAGTGGSDRGGAGGHAPASQEPRPSPGCQLGTASPAERSVDPTFSLDVVRKFPAAYDGHTPMPLVFALHATNFTASSMVSYLKQDPATPSRYVIVAPQEKTTLPSNFESRKVDDFSRLLDNVLAELCIDESQIFGVGNGSGGRALLRWVDATARQAGAAVAPRLRAVAMVGTYISHSVPMSGGLPALFIHPLTSTNSAGVAQDSDGTKALATFRSRNQCGETTSAVTASSCVAGGMPVNPGCVDFLGCVQPLRFCHHDDLTNQTAGDPWTCMATPAIYQFFAPFAADRP